MSELDKKIVEDYYEKHHFYSSVPEMLIYVNFSIAIIIAIQPKILMEIEPIKTIIAISWAVICFIFLIYSIFKERSLEKKIEKVKEIHIQNIKKQENIVVTTTRL